MYVDLQQHYVKVLLVRQGAGLKIFKKIHGLSLKLIVNYVTHNIFMNTYPLLAPLLPHRAHGCLSVVVALLLLIYLIVAAVSVFPLLLLLSFLFLIKQMNFSSLLSLLLSFTPSLLLRVSSFLKLSFSVLAYLWAWQASNLFWNDSLLGRLGLASLADTSCAQKSLGYTLVVGASRIFNSYYMGPLLSSLLFFSESLGLLVCS